MTNLIYQAVLFGSVQGILLGIVLLTRPQNRTANRILAAIVLLFSIRALIMHFLLTSPTTALQALSILTWPFIFLFAPMYYLYCHALLFHTPVFQWKNSVHLVPFISLFALVAVYFGMSIAGLSVEVFEAPDSLFSNIIDTTYMILFVLMGWIYTALVWRLLRDYSRRIHEFYSNLAHRSLLWLWILTAFQVVIWSYETVITVLSFTGTTVPEPIEMITFLILTLLVYVIGYFTLNQPEVLAGQADDEKPKKYSRSGLDESKALAVRDSLVQFMEKERPHINGDVTLKDLAEKLDISEHNLSEVINSQIGLNFYDFVNLYRVEDAKKKLVDPAFRNFNILAVAMESGFNSKSTFNAIFKKHTGQTPTEYRAQALKGTSIAS